MDRRHLSSCEREAEYHDEQRLVWEAFLRTHRRSDPSWPSLRRSWEALRDYHTERRDYWLMCHQETGRSTAPETP